MRDGKIRVDDAGVTCGSWHVPLYRAAECHEPERTSKYAILAAVECPHATLYEIQLAFTLAFARAHARQPNWRATRERMAVIRRAWPIIARACRKAIAGEV